MDILGRKRTCQFLVAPCFFMAYITIFMSGSGSLIIAARFFLGTTMGINLSATTIYLVEISCTKTRGTLGCLVQLMNSVGVLTSFAFGIVCNWYFLALLNGCLSIPFGIALWTIPESPRWLAMKGTQLKLNMRYLLATYSY
jgi:hypothetical protein